MSLYKAKNGIIIVDDTKRFLDIGGAVVCEFDAPYIHNKIDSRYKYGAVYDGMLVASIDGDTFRYVFGFKVGEEIIYIDYMDENKIKTRKIADEERCM